MATGGDFGENPDHRELTYSEKVQRNLSDNRPMLVRYMFCTECLPSLTGVIDGFDQDFDLYVRRVKETRGQEEANEIFLKKIEDSTDSGKWEAFINSLQQLDYDMLVRLLTGEPVNNDRERYVKLVDLLTPELIQDMDLVALLPYLSQKDCLNERDKQNIECTARERRDKCATELLLSRVTRLKDNWFRGFMIALRRVGMTELMREIDPDYTEKSDEDDLDCASGMNASPPSDYQTEWFETVSKGQNTLLLGPRHSDKTFVTIKLIQAHLSRKDSPSAKVAYISTEQKKIMDVREQWKETETTTVVQGTGPFRRPDMLRFRLLIMSGKACYSALSEGAIRFSDFSLVIVDLGVDYFDEEKHVYKKIVSHFHNLKETPPQILVLSASVCGNGKDWLWTDMMGVAMDVCADFGIQNTVETTKGSSKNVVTIPLVERTPIPERQNKEFSRIMEELMFRVEKEMGTKHASLGDQDYPVPKMVELSKAPADRTSVKYMAWLKANKATLSDLVDRHKNRSAKFFLRCIKLLQLFQEALFISTECRSVDGIKHVEKTMKQAVPGAEQTNPSDPLKALIADIFEKIKTLKEQCLSPGYRDPMPQALRKKLVALYADGRRPKVVILVKYPVVVRSMRRYLAGVSGIKCKGACSHDKAKEMSKDLENEFDVLVTTWPLLAYHLNEDPHSWDCIIRTDCPYNGFVAWEHKDLERPGVGSFSQDETTPPEGIDLLSESSIETTTMEIVQLQRNSIEEYTSALRDLQTRQKERRLAQLNSEIEQPLEENSVEFCCHGCGTFVCNACYIQTLDNLWICTDEKVIHKLKTIKHPEPIRYQQGYARLGRFVCKQCGEKWGIVVSVLLHAHLAFHKLGLDIYRDGCFTPYEPEWNNCGVDFGQFHHNRDLLRCLPSTFCVDGEPVTDLLQQLPSVS